MKNKFVVAIGSSEGGLEPMFSFFDVTPHDQATYVILRHIPFDHQSHLHTILQRHSRLKIVEATDDTLIEKDTVYMPPASMYMTINHDRLYLQKRIEREIFPNWSVDVFLTSLAKAKGKKAIAVILSGNGTDGTKGARLIKEAGGMVIAQTPSSCVHSGMPVSIINEGLADHILLPSEMSHVILHHANTILKNTNEVQNMIRVGGGGEK